MRFAKLRNTTPGRGIKPDDWPFGWKDILGSLLLYVRARSQPCRYHRDGSRFIRQITHTVPWSIGRRNISSVPLKNSPNKKKNNNNNRTRTYPYNIIRQRLINPKNKKERNGEYNNRENIRKIQSRKLLVVAIVIRPIHHGSIGSTHRAGYNKFIKERGTKPFRSEEERK